MSEQYRELENRIQVNYNIAGQRQCQAGLDVFMGGIYSAVATVATAAAIAKFPKTGATVALASLAGAVNRRHSALEGFAAAHRHVQKAENFRSDLSDQYARNKRACAPMILSETSS